MPNFHHCTCTAALLLGALTAQSGGPTLAIAHGFSVDPATPLPIFTPASVVTTSTDLDAEVPLPEVPLPGRPNFGALPIPGGLDIDAFSLGLDWIPFDGTGEVAVPPVNGASSPLPVRRTTV